MEPPFRTWIGFPAKQAVESSTSAENAIPKIRISAQPLTCNQYFMCDMQANLRACVYVYRFGNGDCLCFPRSLPASKWYMPAPSRSQRRISAENLPIYAALEPKPSFA